LKRPVDVSLELSSTCNMACNYCYHSDPKTLPFKKGFMSFETASRIIMQAADLGVSSLKTNYRGESTINPQFEAITSLAKSLARGGTFIDRITNSNFKFSGTKEDVFRGLCNQTKVKVSFDSFRKDVFETQRAGGIYDLALNNIEKFYNYPGRDNVLVIQAVRTKLNRDEDIEGEVKRRWPAALVSVRDVVEGRVDKDLNKYAHKTRDTSERQSCLQSHVRIIFTWDGRALPCCPDIKEQLVIGDINKQSMREIFNSIAAKELRKSLLDKSAFDKSPCKSCPSFETYKGYKPPWNS
jgi:radical SAM protein with 4Fe4S-binding SPASM domain